jgi:hypothetical protein
LKNQYAQTCPGYPAVITIALISAFIAAITVVCIYHHRFAQQIKVVDLKGYLRSQAALLSAGEIDKVQWQENLEAMEKRLQNQPANHVVLLKEVVLKNGEELHIH